MLTAMLPGFPESNYYKKDQQHTTAGIPCWKISPIGDGNCGLYAFILGLIDVITTGRLTLKEERFTALRKAVIENISQLENIPFEESLIVPICQLKQFLDNSDLTFSKFKDFLLAQNTYTYEQPATINAILFVFSQTLREIGYTTYLQEIVRLNATDNFHVPIEDINLLENGQWVGEEILSSLAKYFEINIKLIVHSDNPNKCFTFSPQETSTPLFSLLHNINKAHWYYLLPVAQTNGLACFLPPDKATEEKKANQHLPLLARQRKTSQPLQASKESHENKVSLKRSGLSIFAKKLKKILYDLKEIFEKEANDSQGYQKSLGQANLVVNNSTEILDKVRRSLDHQQLDKSLNRLCLLEIEKTLIKKPLVIDDSTDTLAVALQNVEIVDFFLRNSEKLPTTLFFSKPVNLGCRSPSLKTFLPSPRWLSCS